ncbi:hypothetical protein [Cellulomonas chengniuliangii]|uniref:restriction system modified-DNA reader domain-containing protein n=1 Tax=Cellulomonas chengniuliangii TaxID=2968084 RepID=UPI001D0EAE27|nr:hypothetical protein [Cellulomonas chengniuliangii]MCC2318002.1 hypothetical protein [Cellulomonas chengniuliangii]
MPIFELDEGRPLLVQPMQPAAGTFAPDASALVTEHLTALLGEELFLVTTRTAPEGAQLLALDAAGRPVVVETAPVLDGPALVRALNHAGTAATRTRGELLRAYDGGRSAFDADLAAFRERVPMRGGATDGAVRLVVLCAEVDAEIGDAVAFLRSTGDVQVLQTGVVQGADGRRFVEVSPWSHDGSTARRAVEPAPTRAADPVLDLTSRHAHTAAQAIVPPPVTAPPASPVSVSSAEPVAAPARDLPAATAPASESATTSDLPPTPAPLPTPALLPTPAPLPAQHGPQSPRNEPGRRAGSVFPSPARPTPASARVDETIVLPAGAVEDFDEELGRTRPSVDRWEPATAATGAPAAAPPEDDARWTGPSRRNPGAAEWPDLASTGMHRVAPDWAAVTPEAASSSTARPATSPTPGHGQWPAPERPSGTRAPFVPPTGPQPAARRVSAVPPPADLTPWTGVPSQPTPRPHPALAALAGEQGAATALVWVRARRGQRLVATLRVDGVIELPDGQLVSDPDEAAATAADAEGTVDGWRAWRLGDGGPTLLEATGA